MNPAEFSAATEAMFAKAQIYMDTAPREWALAVATLLVHTTPGPGLQFPEDTLYLATGQLRGGWNFGINPPSDATIWKGGPEEDRGDATISALRDQIYATPLEAGGALYNEIAYGYIVHHGLGRHTIARPWVLNAEVEAPALLPEAQEKARAVAGL